MVHPPATSWTSKTPFSISSTLLHLSSFHTSHPRAFPKTHHQLGPAPPPLASHYKHHNQPHHHLPFLGFRSWNKSRLNCHTKPWVPLLRLMFHESRARLDAVFFNSNNFVIIITCNGSFNKKSILWSLGLHQWVNTDCFCMVTIHTWYNGIGFAWWYQAKLQLHNSRIKIHFSIFWFFSFYAWL